MTSKIFSVATFIVVSWLAITVVTTAKRVNKLETSLLNGLTASVSAMNTRITAMETAQKKNHQSLLARLASQPVPAPVVVHQPIANTADTNALKNEAEKLKREQIQSKNQTEQLRGETEKLKKELEGYTKFAEINKAYRDVIESEMEKDNDAEKAAEKLLSTKSAIWKASTQYPDLKESLQGLMAPIDITASRWKSGDTKGTVRPVFKVLKQTLATLDAN